MASPKLTLALLGAAPVLLAASSALAVRAPLGLSSGGLETAPGIAPARIAPSVAYDAPPASRRAAWGRFLLASGGSWRALWDRGTGAPRRIFGSGVPAAGSVASAEAAEAHARAFLAAHLDLCAPGVDPGDFALASDDLDRGMRTVAFVQRSGGAPVVGGQVSFRYRADRLFMIACEAVPAGAAAEPPEADAPSAAIAAQRWIASTHAIGTCVGDPELVVLPIVRAASVEVRRAWRVRVEAEGPRAAYDVFVDARSGAPLAREQLLRFATATLRFDAPLRGPQDERAAWPARLADVVVDGASAVTDDAGAFAWPGPAAAALEASVHGGEVAVKSFGDPEVTTLFSADDGGELTWSLADDEQGDAQLSSFIHAGVVLEHARGIAPGMGFLGQKLPVRVNRWDGTGCNAYWDGVGVNFLRESGPCNNTGRVADVVYHELGHGFHQHAIQFGVGAADAALGEGGADFMAASVTGDHRIAPGFFLDGGTLRDIEQDRRWPDDIDADPHETGLIIAGALWDLRKDLVGELGEAEGAATADLLYFGALRRASDIPTSYPEVLAADDDDGDLANGTPHVCAINRAFAVHGLSGGLGAAAVVLEHEALSTVAAGDEPYPIHVGSRALYPECDGAAGPPDVAAVWRGSNGTIHSVPLIPDGLGGFDGEIPGQVGGVSFSYQIVASSGGSEIALPQNPADDRYKVFVGETRPLFCDGFEGSPGAWVAGASDGGPGDFEQGAPAGQGGDPDAPFAGAAVLGDRLGDNGKYPSNRVAWVDSPVVDLAGEHRVRLQLRRWLTVEDGYFDQASIYVNGSRVWQNRGTDETNGSMHHTDREWRFEDLDLAYALSGATTAQVRFELASDASDQRGGWTIDDVCLVAVVPPPAEEPADEPKADAPPSFLAGGGACAAAPGDSTAGAGGALVLAALVLSALRLRRRAPIRRTSSQGAGESGRISFARSG